MKDSEFLQSPLRHLLKHANWAVTAITLLSLTLMLFSVIPAVAFGWTIDEVLIKGTRHALAIVIPALIFTQLLEFALELCITHIRGGLIERLAVDSQRRAISYLSSQPLQALEQIPGSTIASRIESIEIVVRFYIDLIEKIISAPLFTLIIFMALTFESRVLSFIVFVVTALYSAIYWVVSKKLKKEAKILLAERDGINRNISEFSNNILQLKILGRVQSFYENLQKLRKKSFEDRGKTLMRREFLQQLTDSYSRCALIIILGVGAVLVMHHHLSVGHLVSANLIFRRMVSQIRSSMPLIQRYYQTQNAIEAINDVFVGNGNISPKFYGMMPAFSKILFREVGFRYQADKELTIQSSSFSIDKGDVVAIIGPSGSGKTTLLKLISRFYAPTEGEVIYSPESEEKSTTTISFIGQNSTIFRSTIMENIAMTEDGDMDRVVRAANLACADDFIVALKKGYDTHISSDKISLSDGQKHRLALARAFYIDADVMFLDEPTASLDHKNEARLMSNVKRHITGKTLFISTHRLAPISLATKILYVDGGEVKEFGKPEDLIKIENGFFKAWLVAARSIEKGAGQLNVSTMRCQA